MDGGGVISDVFEDRMGCGGGVDGTTISTAGESCESASILR